MDKASVYTMNLMICRRHIKASKGTFQFFVVDGSSHFSSILVECQNEKNPVSIKLF